jgi:hypothetical protein
LRARTKGFGLIVGGCGQRLAARTADQQQARMTISINAKSPPGG